MIQWNMIRILRFGIAETVNWGLITDGYGFQISDGILLSAIFYYEHTTPV